MTLESIIREFTRFVQTQDYVDGLIVALTGIAIELILLLIAVPIFFHIMRGIQTRPIRAAADYYLFQIFRRIIHMLLDMGGIDDIAPILKEEKKKDPRLKTGGHPIYKSLEEMLFVFDRVFIKSNQAYTRAKDYHKFMEELEKKNLDDFQRYANTSDKCLAEIDRLAAMYIDVPTVQKMLFNTRQLVYPLNEMMYRVTADTRPRSTGTDLLSFIDYIALERYVMRLVKEIDQIFRKRKKLIDSMMKHRDYLRKLRLLFLSPYTFVRPWISIRICRFRGKPYEDSKYGTLLFRHYLLEWRLKNRFSIEQAAQVLGMSVDEYRDYEYHYREPTAKWQDIKKHLRGEVDYSQFRKKTEGSDGQEL